MMMKELQNGHVTLAAAGLSAQEAMGGKGILKHF
jgi:hypothetical protein